MQRYTVNFKVSDAATRRLLVPFPSGSAVRAFASELQQRLARIGVTVDASAIVFCLDDANGPLIDLEDALEDVVLDPHTEQLYASVSVVSLSNGSNSTSDAQQGSTTTDFDFLVCFIELFSSFITNALVEHS
jgi:hypothetical protein